MSRLVDLTGQRFGRLVVIEKSVSGQGRHVRWLCQCDCGNTTIVDGGNLKAGRTKSCGCYVKEGNSHRTHGDSRTRLYRIWRGIKQRCYCPKASHYKSYGGRGITMCGEWLNSFEAFRDWSLSNGYRDDLSIDRKDNNRGYSPDNCGWSTNMEQANNKRTNVLFTIHGQTKSMNAWARELGITKSKIETMHRRGKDVAAYLEAEYSRKVIERLKNYG